MPDAPARALIFDSSYDQYRGVIAFVRVVDGRLDSRAALRAMALGTQFDAEELGYMSPTRVPGRGPRVGRGGVRRDGPQGRLASPSGRHPDDAARAARASRCPGTRTSSRWCSRVCSRPTPTTTRTCETRSRSSSSTTLRSFYEPETSTGARVRLPLRLSRASPHGDRARAARARVRSRSARHRAERRVPGADEGRRARRGAQPGRHAARARAGRGAVHPCGRDRPEGLRRCRSWSSATSGVASFDHMEYLSAERVLLGLRAAARRGRARLLRSAEVADAGVRELRLRPRRVPRGSPGPRRRPGRRRAGRRAVARRAPGLLRTSGASSSSRSSRRRSRGRCSTSPSRRRSARA